MQYKTLSFLLLSATALAASESGIQKKQYDHEGDGSSYGDSGSPSYENSSYESLIGSLNSLATNTDYATAFNNLPTDYESYMPTGAMSLPSGVSFDLPPSSIQSVLATAVPASYFSQMANPSARSSIFSEIQNGHYPSWYQALPGDIKTYLSTHYATATGAVQTGSGSTTTAASGTAVSSTAGSGSDSESGSTSTSQAGAGAPAATGAVAAGLAGAAGILGLAIML